MFQSFDISALLITLVGVFLFRKQNSTAIFICIYLFLSNFIHMIELRGIGGLYYVLLVALYTFMIYASIIFKVNKNVFLIFLCSMTYNGLSFIEFYSSYSFIFDSYEGVMQLLMFLLVINVFKNGALLNGTKRDNSRIHSDTDTFSACSLHSRKIH